MYSGGQESCPFPTTHLGATLKKEPCDNRRAMALSQETELLFLNIGRSGLAGTWACLHTISAKMQPRLQMSTAVE